MQVKKFYLSSGFALLTSQLLFEYNAWLFQTDKFILVEEIDSTKKSFIGFIILSNSHYLDLNV